MATRKRKARQSGLVGRAVSAGRRAWKEAEGRIPPDLRRQLDRRLKDADKTARAAIKQLQTQVQRASTRADVNSVLKRIDGLTKQARQIASGTAPRATTSSRATTTRRRTASTTKRAAATKTRRAPASTKRAATTRRAAPARRPSRPRRTREEAVPIAEVDDIEIIEVIEP